MKASLPSVPSLKSVVRKFRVFRDHESRRDNQYSGIKLVAALGRQFSGLTCLALLGCGCQVLTYSSPTGERFTRSSFGASTSIQSLSVEATTNGIRKVHVSGYQNNSTEALGAVTDAAVKAAISASKP